MDWSTPIARDLDLAFMHVIHRKPVPTDSFSIYEASAFTIMSVKVQDKNEIFAFVTPSGHVYTPSDYGYTSNVYFDTSSNKIIVGSNYE